MDKQIGTAVMVASDTSKRRGLELAADLSIATHNQSDSQTAIRTRVSDRLRVIQHTNGGNTATLSLCEPVK